jgi:HPt (histidine-containing phosphotransfer) domain-containing protein
LLKRIIDAYLEDTPKLIEKMKDAVDKDDTFEVAKAAHTLKSSSGNVGAVELSDRCKQLEALARRGSLGMVRELLADVEAAYIGVQAALVAERGDGERQAAPLLQAR